MFLLSRLWPILAIIILVVAVWVHGRQTGIAMCEAAYIVKQAEHTKEVIRREEDRLTIEAEREALARDLEDQANADPATSECLSVDRVRRLNLR